MQMEIHCSSAEDKQKFFERKESKNGKFSTENFYLKPLSPSFLKNLFSFCRFVVITTKEKKHKISKIEIASP